MAKEIDLEHSFEIIGGAYGLRSRVENERASCTFTFSSRMSPTVFGLSPNRCAEFLAKGLITEKNLDGFDTTCLTWCRPRLSRERLSELLFDCYRNFFSLRHALRNAKDELSFPGRGVLGTSAANTAMSLFSRYCAWRRTHPMSGGIKRVRLDGVDDFLSLRREAFGFELAPLPRSLQLPTAEIPLTPRGQPVHAVASSSDNGPFPKK